MVHKLVLGFGFPSPVHFKSGATIAVVEFLMSRSMVRGELCVLGLSK